MNESVNSSEGNYPHVFIIILNYNGWEDTIECLESVLRIEYPNYKVLLIDNASENESIERIMDWAGGKIKIKINPNNELQSLTFPPIEKPLRIKILDSKKSLTDDHINSDIILIKNEKNLGFAGGNNIGINLALNNNADYCLLLNNDTVVTKDFLKKLISGSEKISNFAFAGSLILQYYNTKKVWAAGGGEVNKFTAITKHKLLDINFDASRVETKELDYVTGCCLLASINVIKKLGLMDENYFLYYEETDWCIRAQNHGMKNIFVPSSVIYHKEVSRKRKDDTTGTYYYTRNRNYFIKNNFSGLQKKVIQFNVFIYNWLRIFYHLIKGNREKFKAMLKALKDYKSGKMGKRK